MSFADDMAADLASVFFTDFAEDVTYRPAVGTPYTIKAIFTQAHETVSYDGMSQIASTSPVMKVIENAISGGAKKGDTVTIRGVLFTVEEPQPDGHGVITLRLHEA